MGRMKEGQSVSFTVNAFPNRTYEGRVLMVRLGAQTIQNVVTYTTIVRVHNVDQLASARHDREPANRHRRAPERAARAERGAALQARRGLPRPVRQRRSGRRRRRGLGRRSAAEWARLAGVARAPDRRSAADAGAGRRHRAHHGGRAREFSGPRARPVRRRAPRRLSPASPRDGDENRRRARSGAAAQVRRHAAEARPGAASDKCDAGRRRRVRARRRRPGEAGFAAPRRHGRKRDGGAGRRVEARATPWPSAAGRKRQGAGQEAPAGASARAADVLRWR